MCSRTVTGEVKFRPQHRPKCYCQMRDKWCKSTGTTVRPCGESAEQRCANGRGTAVVSHGRSDDSVAPSPWHPTKVALDARTEPRRRSDNQVSANPSKVALNNDALTDTRLAYEKFRSAVLAPKRPAVCQVRAQELARSNRYSLSGGRSVDLSEIREYRAANPDNCCGNSSSSSSWGIASSSTTLSSVKSGHSCQVRCCFDKFQNVVPCDVDANGLPLCSICGRVFSTEVIALQQFSGSSHPIRVVNRRGSTDNQRRDYSAVLDRPSVILEIHEHGKSRDMALFSKNSRVADIRITNKLRPPNSLALKHQPTL